MNTIWEADSCSKIGSEWRSEPHGHLGEEKPWPRGGRYTEPGMEAAPSFAERASRKKQGGED